MQSTEISQSSPAFQAVRILEAFSAGNQPLLYHELQKTRHLGPATAPGLEEERLELLRAVSEGMLRAGDPLSLGRRDPAIRRCLDLLAHLAQPTSLNRDSRKNVYQLSPQLM